MPYVGGVLWVFQQDGFDSVVYGVYPIGANTFKGV